MGNSTFCVCKHWNSPFYRKNGELQCLHRYNGGLPCVCRSNRELPCLHRENGELPFLHNETGGLPSLHRSKIWNSHACNDKVGNSHACITPNSYKLLLSVGSKICFIINLGQIVVTFVMRFDDFKQNHPTHVCL